MFDKGKRNTNWIGSPSAWGWVPCANGFYTWLGLHLLTLDHRHISPQLFQPSQGKIKESMNNFISQPKISITRSLCSVWGGVEWQYSGKASWRGREGSMTNSLPQLTCQDSHLASFLLSFSFSSKPSLTLKTEEPSCTDIHSMHSSSKHLFYLLGILLLLILNCKLHAETSCYTQVSLLDISPYHRVEAQKSLIQ